MALINAYMRNVYTGPAAEMLAHRASESYVWGEVQVSEFEITTSTTDEGTFIGLLQACVIQTLDAMVELITMTTLPVHDEPPPDWLRKCWAL